MARTKKEKIVLEDKSYYEDLIWMSIRYCIGRHTIASCSHADDIAKYSYNHMSENRRIFNAEDIRNEMNMQFSFYQNLQFEGFNSSYCGFEKMAEWIASGNTIEPGKKYIVDSYNNGDIFVEDSDSKIGCDWQNDYHDYEPWIKLANALDNRCHRILHLENKTQVMDVICFPIWRQLRMDNKYIYEKIWIPLDEYLKSPYMMISCEPSAIKEIKLIQK